MKGELVNNFKANTNFLKQTLLICKICFTVIIKIVSMTRKYHNHKLKANPWHREEEPHNNHQAPGRQTKQSKKLPLPNQDDCKTNMDTT